MTWPIKYSSSSLVGEVGFKRCKVFLCAEEKRVGFFLGFVDK